jgi:hypothetical protein
MAAAAVQWLPWPRPVPGCLETTIMAQDGLLGPRIGDTVSILASASGGYALVARCPEHADCDGVHISPPSSTFANLYVVPMGALTTKASALERHVRALTTKFDRHNSSSLGAASIKVDRVHRGWRQGLRRLLSSIGYDEQQRGSVVQLVNQMGQLAEWRRQDGAPGAAASVRSAILQLADGTTQLSSGVVAPRTDSDELASEANTPPLQLLLLHAETERRLQRGKHVPSQATEALALSVSLGLHGGSAVSNDKAADIGGLGGAAAAAAAAVGNGGDSASGGRAEEEARTPLEQVVASLTAPADVRGSSSASRASSSHHRQPQSALLHIAVDVCLDAALESYSQPVVARVFIYDGVNREPLTEVAELQWRPPPSVPAAPLSTFLGTGDGSDPEPQEAHRWTRAVFSNVPLDLVHVGRCFVAVQLLRAGNLRDDGADAAGQATTARGRSSPGNAIYFRPLAAGALPVPTVLTRLSNATPHRPAPMELRRPAKNDDRAWVNLHRVIIAEQDRDAERQGRRRKVAGSSSGARDADSGSGDDSAVAKSVLQRRLDDATSAATVPVLSGLPVVVRAVVPSVSLGSLDTTNVTATLPVLRPVRWTWRGLARGSVSSADFRAGGSDFSSPLTLRPDAVALPGSPSHRIGGGGVTDRAFPGSRGFQSNRDVLLVSPALAEPMPGLQVNGPTAKLLPAATRGGNAEGTFPMDSDVGLRDELYVTLRRGFFAQDKKVSARNVQVCLWEGESRASPLQFFWGTEVGKRFLRLTSTCVSFHDRGSLLFSSRCVFRRCWNQANIFRASGAVSLTEGLKANVRSLLRNSGRPSITTPTRPTSLKR